VNNEGTVSIVLSGEAGRGLKTIEAVLVRALKLSGLHVFATEEYMSRVRGGNNTVSMVVSSNGNRAFLSRIDILVPLNKNALYRLTERMDEHTAIVGSRESVEAEYRDTYRFLESPFEDMARQVGDSVYANSVAAGMVAGILGIGTDPLKAVVADVFKAKGHQTVAKNQQAVALGYEHGRHLAGEMDLSAHLDPDERVKDQVVLNGAQAVSLGAIAGGCNFIASYPMSPSTGVLAFLAQHASDFGIVCEQAEDEIGAINMGLGASYAGARAMVTTSGGGFALMVEGLSLAGMTETPIVIHLAQRPGPATGLPTRTEQADLLFALRAGHGEFPRIILTPGTLEDAFGLTCRAFNLAERFQVPVFVLTDQYLMDTYYNLVGLHLREARPEKAYVETAADYRRYMLTDTGISPRGIPGHGEGLVMVDSDEHDEYGRITEDMDTREQMVEKRLKKTDRSCEAAIEPEFVGNESFKTLVVGWGSTYYPIKQALQGLRRDEVAFLHLKQVFPFHSGVARYLEKAEQVLTIENNATAQLGALLLQETGRRPDGAILKYDGLPFSVEELQYSLGEIGRESLTASAE
jgi:2-oxoglutarate ferredoxin oxidoreductase subunit alpha